MYRRLAPVLALCCLAASPVFLGAEAAAQGPIRAGQTARGELTASDPTLDDGSHYDIWTYRGRAGERLVVTLRSEDFDAYLAVGQIERGECVGECETDDDSGGDTDARVRITLEEDGVYEIRANSLSEGETGAYSLSVEAGEPQAEAEVREIRLGQTVTGELDDGDARAGDDSFYELWTFRGRPGQRITITLKSDDFDAYLGWGRMEGGEWEEIDSDDDGGGGTDARLEVTVGEAGEYAIRANTLSEGETGSYTLSVQSGGSGGGGGDSGGDDDDGGRGGEPGRITGSIRAGQTVSGRLEASDNRLEDDSFYDLWTYSGRAGETITVTMRSEDFDTFLVIGTLSGGEFEQIESDDDGAGDTDSQIQITLPRSGTFVIRANSLAGDATGAYTLQVQTGRR